MIESINKKGYSIQKKETIAEVIELRENSLFIEDICYYIKDDYSFLKQEDLWEKVLKQSDTPVVIEYSEIDKRSKFYKKYNKEFLYDSSGTEELKKLSDDRDIEILYLLCNNNIDITVSELDKINILNITIEEAINKDIIVDYRDYSLNELVFMVLSKDKKLFDNIDKVDANLFGFIAFLYTNIKNLVLLKSNSPYLNNFIAKNLNNFKNSFTMKELITIMKLLYKVENDIKQGDIEIQFAGIYILLKIFNLGIDK